MQGLVGAGEHHQWKSCSRPKVFTEKLLPPEVFHAKTAPARVWRSAPLTNHANSLGIFIVGRPTRRNAVAQVSENKAFGAAEWRALTCSWRALDALLASFSRVSRAPN